MGMKKKIFFIIPEDAELPDYNYFGESVDLTEYIGQVFVFPFVPGELELSDSTNLEKKETLNGTLLYHDTEKPKEISFKSFFTSTDYFWVTNPLRMKALEFLRIIEFVKTLNIELEFYITGVDFYFNGKIQKFNPTLTKNGDVNYDITIVESKELDIFQSEENKEFVYKAEG